MLVKYKIGPELYLSPFCFRHCSFIYQIVQHKLKMAQYKGPAKESQRVMHLQKKREREQEELEIRKKKLADELAVTKMDAKFSAHYDAVENDLKSSTVGLLTISEMKTKQELAVKEREMILARKNKEQQKLVRKEEKEREKKKQKQNQQIKTLSFNMEEDEEEDEEDDIDEEPVHKKPKESSKDTEDAPSDKKESSNNDNSSIEDKCDKEQNNEKVESTVLKKKRLGKNPDVDTFFLPDVDRDEEENKLREKLRDEWEQRQRKLKEETVEITYSYWDGSGHRKSVNMKKGNTIYQFLQKCLDDLRIDFPELRAVTADQLVYVKEDLIIPQTNTFYDFIVTKARGKSGPLFSFDVSDDIRLVNDATVEKEESHAGKVVLRSWYERNKHIFPASRWEPYDPTKSYEKYTYHDRKKEKS